jgi:hypothetical protein
LAEHAALAHGYKKNAKGLQQTYQDALLSKTIGIDGLVIKDGSGLSKENRVTARTVVSLLTAIRNSPEYAAIYEGLPKSGKTGTLKTRYKKTAPEAVGLIRRRNWSLRSSRIGYRGTTARQSVLVPPLIGWSPHWPLRRQLPSRLDHEPNQARWSLPSFLAAEMISFAAVELSAKITMPVMRSGQTLVVLMVMIAAMMIRMLAIASLRAE